MKKVLWLTNVPLSKVKKDIQTSSVQMGGWLDGISNTLIKKGNIELISIFPFSRNCGGSVEKIKYCSFINGSKDKQQIEFFKKIILENKPQVVHIFGTEYKHTLNMMEACKQLNMLDNVVISIQGLCSICAQKYESGLPKSIVNSFTLRDLLRFDNISLQKKKYENRGKFEIESLKIAKNVIGRTDWDFACTNQINDNLNYYFCNETLRDSFYKSRWNIETCEKKSIFLSQCNYPIKGFHKFLEALKIIVKKYPDVKVYTTGKNILDLKFKDRLKLNTYQRYLIKQIKKNKLENNITFLGFLDEENMCKSYLRANCFVSCSSIENSPNSVGEAMLLGVPTISSDVGGVKNMLKHNEEGFIYPFDETYMLAHYIMKIFEDNKLAKTISKNAQKHALETHNKDKNFETLMKIYEDISLKEDNE